MSGHGPLAELHPDYSDRSATALPWARAVDVLTRAEVFWLSTVRPDGRPHVTPLIGLWSDGALHFCTGPLERKARNLAKNPEVVVTTGDNALSRGLDVVVEGRAVPVTDEARLVRLAELWEAKYGADWHFEVHAGAFTNGAGARAEVFEVAPRKAFGFGKGEPFSQTRWLFG
ncbi:pyridoxamine 5'-phosphate oxidase family protein [Streptomyces sp. LN785]|uniref:pyridoxamine 5'-phosphate oxidase family protein n=1 Tax=Streptomyces sp. LN785 TaxID=3112983 RepID=UPI00371127EE